MQIDWWTLGLQAVNVLVLVWLLARFLFRPVVAIAERRREETTAALDEAHAARKAADEALAAAREQVSELAAAREGALSKLQTELETQRNRLLERARVEAQALREAAQNDIEQQRELDHRRQGRLAGQLAVDIAARLLTRMPLPAPAQFLPGLVAALQSLPASSRADMIAGTPVILRSASELDAGDIERCRQALAATLGQPVVITVEIDPTLIAGLEIRTPHTVVNNHYRADLERISSELRGDGEVPP